MKKVIGSLVAVAGLAAAANAQVNTRVDWQVSMDNVNWSTNVNAQPGNLVFVRALVSYTGTAAPLGLASLVFQPTVANYDLAGTMDVLSPFVNGGQGGNTSTPLGVVSNTADPTQFGRISPFGRSALSSTSFLKGHTHTGGSGGAPAGDWLRIAQAQITNWIGGAGNTSGGSGVGIAQLSDVGRTSNDPAFNGSIQNVQVFKFGITLGDSPHSHRRCSGRRLWQLQLDAPAARDLLVGHHGRVHRLHPRHRSGEPGDDHHPDARLAGAPRHGRSGHHPPPPQLTRPRVI